MKKILVTGGVGFVEQICKEAKDHKLSIFSLDNYSTGFNKMKFLDKLYQ